MSVDSPYDQQERYLAYGSGIYVVIIIWIFYVQLFWPANSPNAEIENIVKVLPGDALALASLTSIAFAVGYFLKYAGIHDAFDNLLGFRFRTEINNLICKRLVEYNNRTFKKEICRESNKAVVPTEDDTLCLNNDKRIKIKDSQLLYIFYEFINRQEDSWLIQRALFFSFMLKYQLSMNLIVFSIIGAIVNLILMAIFSQVDRFGYYSLLPYIFFLMILFTSLIISRKKLRPEIITWITLPQLVRIIHDEGNDLNDLLQNRLHQT